MAMSLMAIELQSSHHLVDRASQEEALVVLVVAKKVTGLVIVAMEAEDHLEDQ